jgi:hypothetical protein
VSAQADMPTMRRAATRPAREHAAVAITSERVAVATVAFVGLVLLVLTWNRWGDLTMDTGYDLVAAGKISHANAPYIDYDYYYGPLGVLVLGALYEVLGIAVWPSVALGLVLAVAGIALGYTLARRLVGPAAAAVVGVCCAVPAFSSANVSWVQPHTLGAPLGILACLGVVLCAARYAQTAATRWLLFTGLAAGATTLTRPEAVGAAALALGGWFAVRLVLAADRRAVLREVATLVGVGLAVPVVGYGAFLLVGHFDGGLSLNELIHDNIFPRGLLDESVSTVYADLAPRTVGSFATLIGKTLLYAAGAGATILAARVIDQGGRRRSVALAVLGLGAVLFLAILLARPDTVRFYLKAVFAWMPAGAAIASAVLVAAALRGRREDRRWAPEAQLELLVALVLLGFSYSLYAKFWPIPNQTFAEGSSYAMPFVATFLVWLHVAELPRRIPAHAATLRAVGLGWVALVAAALVVIQVSDARDETFTVHGPGGSIAATAADGPVYQQAIDVIERETVRSEPILLAPQMTALYVMSKRQDVLPALSLLPGALQTPADEDRAIAQLEHQNLRLAIIDRNPLPRYERGAFGTGYDRRIGAWLRTNFTHISTLRGPAVGSGDPRTLDVWLRRTL